jgi:hypothetical protein
MWHRNVTRNQHIYNVKFCIIFTVWQNVNRHLHPPSQQNLDEPKTCARVVMDVSLQCRAAYLCIHTYIHTSTYLSMYLYICTYSVDLWFIVYSHSTHLHISICTCVSCASTVQCTPPYIHTQRWKVLAECHTCAAFLPRQLTHCHLQQSLATPHFCAQRRRLTARKCGGAIHWLLPPWPTHRLF